MSTDRPPPPDDPRMHGFRSRARVSDVTAHLEARVSPLDPETIVTARALGRVVATPISSPRSVPPFDRSAMDGYALIAEETFGASEYGPIELRVVGQSLPGVPFTGAVRRGEAVRIMTGAPVPNGADAVLEAERTRPIDDGKIAAVGAVTPGKHVGTVGEDVSAGDSLFAAGHPLRAQDIGLLSATGVQSVAVHRRPRVAIIATGRELVAPGGDPGPNEIIDSNTPMLEALVARDSGIVIAAGIVDDDPAAIRAAMANDDADTVVVTGGSSVGEEDHAPNTLRELGEVSYHGIAMRPSSPTGVGFIGDRPVLLLPGNPVSALCAYEFFAGPTIRAQSGRSRAWPHRTVHLPLARKISSITGRVDYVRVAIHRDGDAPSVVPVMVSGASILSSTTRADGVVIVAHDDEGVPPGSMVEVHLYE